MAPCSVPLAAVAPLLVSCASLVGPRDAQVHVRCGGRSAQRPLLRMEQRRRVYEPLPPVARLIRVVLEGTMARMLSGWEHLG